MHNHRIIINRLAGLLAAGLLANTIGCHTPKHSNVLVFATNTKLAFDISYDPKIQQPNITLGYTRQEGVWMPLLANRGENGLEPAQPKNGTRADGHGTPQPDDLYVGNEGETRDTYSVLATFKGNGSAKGSGTNGSEMSGSIAQYFATGLAARKLAENGGAALVSTKAMSPAESYGLRLTRAAKEGSTVAMEADGLVDRIATDAGRFKAVAQAAEDSGIVEPEDAAELNKTAAVDLMKARTDLKSFHIAFSPADVRKLSDYVAKLKAIK